MAAVIQVKRGTASSWTSANTVLAAGEIGFETDTKKMKVGDGSTAWTSLGYTATDGDISSVVAGTGLSGGGTSGAVTLNLSTPVAATNGGTGLSTFTTGDLPYASATNTLSKLGIGSTGQVLTVSGGVPTWAAAASGNTNPAFRAYRNGTQTVTSGADTKVALNAESFDTNNCFDSTTNYRFTPNVAGYYQFNAGIGFGGTSITRLIAYIYKNGSTYSRFYDASNGDVYDISGSDLIYANGTTDYFEFYALVSGSSPNFGGGEQYTWFSGSWVRS